MDPSNTFSEPRAAELAAAAKAGDRDRIRELVVQGADPNVHGANDIPLLQWTMLNGSRSGFTALLDAGAEPTRGNADGTTAVHLAAQADTPFYLQTLLDRGISPNTPNTVTGAAPLISALKTHRADNADLLLEAGANLDATDRQGDTALHLAAMLNQNERVLQLLEAGADPLARNVRGTTFQRYVFKARNPALNAQTLRERDAIRAWLRQHNVPIEDAATQ